MWRWNDQRLHSELSYRTPTEVEAAYCADLETAETATAASKNTGGQTEGEAT